MTNTSGTCRNECDGGGVDSSGHGDENELDEGVAAVKRLVMIIKKAVKARMKNMKCEVVVKDRRLGPSSSSTLANELVRRAAKRGSTSRVSHMTAPSKRLVKRLLRPASAENGIKYGQLGL